METRQGQLMQCPQQSTKGNIFLTFIIMIFSDLKITNHTANRIFTNFYQW
jgi:hypothetical protein